MPSYSTSVNQRSPTATPAAQFTLWYMFPPSVNFHVGGTYSRARNWDLGRIIDCIPLKGHLVVGNVLVVIDVVVVVVVVDVVVVVVDVVVVVVDVVVDVVVVVVDVVVVVVDVVVVAIISVVVVFVVGLIVVVAEVM